MWMTRKVQLLIITRDKGTGRLSRKTRVFREQQRKPGVGTNEEINAVQNTLRGAARVARMPCECVIRVMQFEASASAGAQQRRCSAYGNERRRAKPRRGLITAREREGRRRAEGASAARYSGSHSSSCATSSASASAAAAAAAADSDTLSHNNNSRDGN